MRYFAYTSACLIAAYCLVLPTTSSAQTEALGRSVADFGVVGDGKTDDSAALQNAVDARLGNLILPRGVFRLSKPIIIDLNKVGPTSFIGGGSARLVMAGPGPALKFVGTHDGTAAPESVKPEVWQRQRMPMVAGLEIIGEHDEAIGIEASGTMQLTITRVNIRDTLHAIHLVERNRNVIISDCHLYENRGVGLFLDDVNLHQINVTGSHISYNRAGGIVARSGNVRNLHITGCDIEGNMSADGPLTANVLIDSTDGQAGVGEVAITGCTIQHAHDSPGSANIRIIGRDAAGKTRGNVTITGNVISDTPVNIDLNNVRGVSIVGNTIWKGHHYNMRIIECQSVVVGPNCLDRNPAYQNEATALNGVLFGGCRDMTIQGLHIQGTRGADAGLILDNCHRVNITGCTILDCENGGIVLHNVTATRVSGCMILNGLEDGKPWDPAVISDKSEVYTSDNLMDPKIPADAPAEQPAE